MSQPPWSTDPYAAPQSPGHASEAPQAAGYAAPAPYPQTPSPYGYPPAAPPAPMGYSVQVAPGEKAAQVSLVLGIVSLFVAGLGVVVGPLAIWQASKAERLGASATGGKVLGWIGTVLGAAQAVFAVLFIGGMMAAGGMM